MFLCSSLSLIIVSVNLVFSQSLSDFTLYPTVAPDGSNISVSVQLLAPFSPTWFFVWKIDGVIVSTLHNPPGSPFISVTITNSSYSNRIHASVSNSSFDGSRSFSAHLFIQASAADNGSSITAMLTFSSSQRSGVLLVSPNSCPRFFSSNLTVEYNFTILGAVGTFSCLEGGYPFFRNLSSPLSLRTDCTDQFTWRGYSDLECRYPPDVKLRFFSSITSGLALICEYKCPVSSCSTIFYIGDEARVMNSSFYALPSINTTWIGSAISCQAITPYTRRFNMTGRSKSLTIQPFSLPSPVETSCQWLLNLSQVCDVIFDASPKLEFKRLRKNGTILENVSDTISGNSTTHIYRFRKQKVSRNDFGRYQLDVSYTLYPGLVYAIEFSISPRSLPDPHTCFWFTDELGSCGVPLPSDATILSATFNDTSLDESSFTISSGMFRISVLQASPDQSGLYSVDYRLPSGIDNQVRFKVFVRDYPFNAGLVIGIALAALVLLIVLVILCFKAPRKSKESSEQNETARNIQKSNPAKTSVANTAF